MHEDGKRRVSVKNQKHVCVHYNGTYSSQGHNVESVHSLVLFQLLPNSRLLYTLSEVGMYILLIVWITELSI